MSLLFTVSCQANSLYQHILHRTHGIRINECSVKAVWMIWWSVVNIYFIFNENTVESHWGEKRGLKAAAQCCVSARAWVRAAGSAQSAPFWESSPLGRVQTLSNVKDTNKGRRKGFRMEPGKRGGWLTAHVSAPLTEKAAVLSRGGDDLRCKIKNKVLKCEKYL